MIMHVVWFAIGVLTGLITFVIVYDYKIDDLKRMAEEAEKICDATLDALERLEEAQNADKQ